jgi:hypothetical protein
MLSEVAVLADRESKFALRKYQMNSAGVTAAENIELQAAA